MNPDITYPQEIEEFKGKVGTLTMCNGCKKPSYITIGRKQCHVHDNDDVFRYIELATPMDEEMPTKLSPAGYTSLCSQFELELTKEQHKTFMQIRRDLEGKSGIANYFMRQRTNDLVLERLEVLFGPRELK